MEIWLCHIIAGKALAYDDSSNWLSLLALKGFTN